MRTGLRSLTTSVAALACVLAASITPGGGPTSAQAVQSGTPGRTEPLPIEPVMVTAGELFRMLQRLDGASLTIIDLREPEEYAVSHLPGSRRLAFGSDPGGLSAEPGLPVRGRHVVFYCSIAIRSTEYAGKAIDTLETAGALSVSVLASGVVGWINEGLQLVDSQGRPTRRLMVIDSAAVRLVGDPTLLVAAPSASN